MNSTSSNSPLTRDIVARISKPDGTGTGLPSECYTSDDWLKQENETLFRKTWMLAGLCHQIPNGGDAVPIEVAGLPLLLLRDSAGDVRVFHNVCRHRGAILIDEACSKIKSLVCPYHAWTYGLDGDLLARPHFFGGEQHDLEPGEDAPSLVPVRHAVWNDLVFVNIDAQAPSFDEHFAPFTNRTKSYDFSALRYAATLDFDIAGNWKLVYENFLDPYHVPRVHPRLDKFTSMAERPAVEMESNWFHSKLPIDEPQLGRAQPLPYYPGLDERGRHTERFFHLFPTMCLQIWPDQLAVFQLHALAPGRTIEHIHMYFVGDAASDPAYEELRQDAYDMWNQLNTEDFTIVENMHKARASPAFDGGSLSPYWDRSTQYFAKLIVSALT